MWEWLVARVAKDWAVIKQAPLAFVFCIALGVAIGGLGAAGLYGHQVASLTADRDLYRDQRATQPPSKAATMPPQLGDAPLRPISGSVTLDSVPLALVGASFNGRTEAEAQRILQPYVGRPVRVSGIVENVSATMTGKIQVALKRAGPLAPDAEGLYLFFEKSEAANALPLRLGDRVQAQCSVDAFTLIGMTLGECKITP